MNESIKFYHGPRAAEFYNLLTQNFMKNVDQGRLTLKDGIQSDENDYQHFLKAYVYINDPNKEGLPDLIHISHYKLNNLFVVSAKYPDLEYYFPVGHYKVQEHLIEAFHTWLFTLTIQSHVAREATLKGYLQMLETKPVLFEFNKGARRRQSNFSGLPPDTLQLINRSVLGEKHKTNFVRAPFPFGGGYF